MDLNPGDLKNEKGCYRRQIARCHFCPIFWEPSHPVFQKHRHIKKTATRFLLEKRDKKGDEIFFSSKTCADRTIEIRPAQQVPKRPTAQLVVVDLMNYLKASDLPAIQKGEPL